MDNRANDSIEKTKLSNHTCFSLKTVHSFILSPSRAEGALPWVVPEILDKEVIHVGVLCH